MRHNAISKCKQPTNTTHEHRGKSSERLVDKDTILEALNIVGGQTILDAGCGNGYMTKEFSRLLSDTGKVYGLDLDKEAIAILKKETEGTNIEPLAADITQTTPIPSSSLDLIYMSTVFHGFTKDQITTFQKEAERLLKPSAILAILEINKEDTPFGPSSNLRYSPKELRQIIALNPKATIAIGPYFYMQLFQNRG